MLVVVGGHSRNVGKTSVVAGLIEALPQRNWTAMKITQFGHGICSSSGSACDCQVEAGCPYAISRELEPNRTDTGRFLAAGARLAYWVRTAAGQVGNAAPAIRDILNASQNLVIESNSIIEFLAPDVYLVVLDFAQPDFKLSTKRFLKRAHACVVVNGGMPDALWKDVAREDWELLPRFPVAAPQYVSPALAAFVDRKGQGLRP